MKNAPSAEAAAEGAFFCHGPICRRIGGCQVHTRRTPPMLNGCRFPTSKRWYDALPEEATEVGEMIEVFSKKGEYMCTIEITKKYELPFGQIDDETVRGENCASYEEFRKDHIVAWEDDLKREGEELNDHTVIVVEHFRLIK